MLKLLRSTALTSAILGALAFMAPTAQAKCPPFEGNPAVYGVGGSTMGTVLGQILQAEFKKRDITFHRWGKASSGLARPDFHDWPKTAPGLMRQRKPDFVIVSLGTNDYQAIYDKKNWVRQDDPNWERIYGERVDALLKGLSTDNPERLIIWSGPYAFEGKNAVVRAPIVNRIMKERVEAFIANGGNAIFQDNYSRTADANGKPLARATLPGADAPTKIRTSDNIHLTAEAVRALMVQPIVDQVLTCRDGKP